jgi:hypothetical protein
MRHLHDPNVLGNYYNIDLLALLVGAYGPDSVSIP